MNIGHASEQTGVSQRMIRHYEGIGLIPRLYARIRVTLITTRGIFTPCGAFAALAT